MLEWYPSPVYMKSLEERFQDRPKPIPRPKLPQGENL